ncbi:hypothetical protein BH09SUM1_BH09SUM1_06540 [soil metagenome]
MKTGPSSPSSTLTARDTHALDARMSEIIGMEKTERGALDAIASALTPLTMLIQGVRFGVGNHDPLIAGMRRLWDPNYLVNDWRLSIPPPHPQVCALLAPVMHAFGEPFLFFMLQFMTRILLLMGVWRLVEALAPRAKFAAAALMAIVVFEPRLHVGDHYLHSGTWEPAHLGMAAAVWTLALGVRLIERRGALLPFALAAGIGIFAHMFIVGPVFAVLWIAILCVRRDWLLSAKTLALALMLGAPSWIPAARGFFGDTGPLTSQQVIQLLQFRHPHHHQPWTWPHADVAQAAVILVATCVAWWRLLAGRREVRFAGAMLIGYFVFSCAAFWIFGSMQRVALIAYMQPFRLFSLVLLSAMAAVVVVLRQRTSARGYILYGVAAIAVGIAFRFGAVWLPAILSIAAAIAARPLPADATERLPRMWPVVAEVISAAGFALMMLQFEGPFDNPSIPEKKEFWTEEYWITNLLSNDADRAGLMHFIRKNTGRDDLFSVPPNMTNFRIWEKRAVIVDSKNVPYDNAGWAAWAERYEDATGVDPYAKFTSIPAGDPPLETLISAAKKYGARYVVSGNSPAVEDARIVYSNAKYVLLDLGN